MKQNWELAKTPIRTRIHWEFYTLMTFGLMLAVIMVVELVRCCS